MGNFVFWHSPGYTRQTQQLIRKSTLLRSRIVILFCVIGLTPLAGQYSDLIITQEGDSIACRIDSVSDQHIHFTALIRGKVAGTHMGLEKVWIYTYDELPENNMSSRSGSRRAGLKPPVDFQAKHTVSICGGSPFDYSTIGAYMEKLLLQLQGGPLKTFWIRGGIGLFYDTSNPAPLASLSLHALSGRNNNHLELGIGVGGISQNNQALDLGSWGFFPTWAVGYRFHPPRETFMFRCGIGLPESVYLGVGVTF